MDKLLDLLRERLALVIIVLILGVLLVIVSVSDNITIWNIAIAAPNSEQKIALLILGCILVIISALLLIRSEIWGNQDKQSAKGAEEKRLITKRDEITQENIRLLLESVHTVNSFSGDLSWVESCESAIKKSVGKGIKINILCKEPRNSDAIPFSLLKKYLREKGVAIKYYPDGLDPQLRGLMIDPNMDCEALFVEKRNKKSGDNYARNGQKGTDEEFDFWGQLYSFDTDQSIIRPFAKLFDILWGMGVDASLLSKGNWGELETELRKLPQYYNADINQKLIKISDMLPLHKHLEVSRYNQVEQLYHKMNRFSLPLYTPLLEYTKGYEKQICPPVVEKHGGKYIIIDGLARIHVARKEGVRDLTVCVIEKVTMPLVGTPWTWDEVKVVEQDTPQKEKFQDFKPEYWRNIKDIDYSLTKVSARS